MHVFGREDRCNDNAALSPPSLSIYSSVEQTASETSQKSFQSRPFFRHCLLQESPINLRVQIRSHSPEPVSIMCFILSPYHSCIQRQLNCRSFPHCSLCNQQPLLTCTEQISRTSSGIPQTSLTLRSNRLYDLSHWVCNMQRVKKHVAS